MMKYKYTFAALAALAVLPACADFYWLAVGIPTNAEAYSNRGLDNYLVLKNTDPSVEFNEITLWDVRRETTGLNRLFRHDLQCSKAFFDGCPVGSVDVDLTLPIKDAEGNDYTFVKINSQGFQDNLYLRSIKLPSTLETIRTCAFRRARNLEKVDFSAVGAALTTVDTVVFSDCEKLAFVEWPAHLTAIPDYTFENSGIVSVAALGATHVGTRAFGGASKFQTLELGDTSAGVTFGDRAFQNVNTATIRKRLFFQGPPPVVDAVFAGTSNGVVDWLTIGSGVDFFLPFNDAKNGPTDEWVSFKTAFEAYADGNSVTFPTYDSATGTWSAGVLYSKLHNRRAGLHFWDPGAATTSALLAY